MISTEHIDELWLRMTKIYGHKWVSAYGAEPDDTWELGLKDVTPEQLGKGLAKCIDRSDPWPPSLPEFRNMCLGLLSKELVVAKVLSGDKSNPVVNQIIQKIGSWNMSHMNEHQMRKAAEAYYETATTEVINDLLRLE